jgi:hypothetical protein
VAEPLERARAIAARNGWVGPRVMAAAIGAAAGEDLTAALHLWSRHNDALTWWERLETHRALHRASGDAWHAAQAERLLGDVAFAPSAGAAGSTAGGRSP